MKMVFLILFLASLVPAQTGNQSYKFLVKELVFNKQAWNHIEYPAEYNTHLIVKCSTPCLVKSTYHEVPQKAEFINYNNPATNGYYVFFPLVDFEVTTFTTEHIFTHRGIDSIVVWVKAADEAVLIGEDGKAQVTAAFLSPAAYEKYKAAYEKGFFGRLLSGIFLGILVVLLMLLLAVLVLTFVGSKDVTPADILKELKK